MLISKFNLNKFFLRKKENKEVDLESTRGEVRSLGKKAGLSYYDRVMLDNVIGFSSIEVEEAMVPRADIVAIPEKSGKLFLKEINYQGDEINGIDLGSIFQKFGSYSQNKGRRIE